MKYRDLSIQTQREAPSNARTEGFAFLVRAGYLTRENDLTLFGEHAVKHLRRLQEESGISFFSEIGLPVLRSSEEVFFPIKGGPLEVIHCAACKYTDRLELARFAKPAPPAEQQLPLEKVQTPHCDTIEALANFLQVPQAMTAKALMYTRREDSQFVFAVVRGDMQLSEAKLKRVIGDVQLAKEEEIIRAGAVPGYASPVGLKHALIIVDDLIPASKNLVAGANEPGLHLKNTNYERDYTAGVVADLVQARENDGCPECGTALSSLLCLPLVTHNELSFNNILLGLAEAYHDERGLTLPRSAAPFEVYLMNVPGKEIDTRTTAAGIYHTLQTAGIAVLFDDRDERAGVKFNDADLIGCPLRLTAGERALKEQKIELKPRTARDSQPVPLSELVSVLKK